MKIYWQYTKYLIEHKWNVFIECMKEGLYLHAFTHDLSKLLPDEFIPYAKNFYGKRFLVLEENLMWRGQNIIIVINTTGLIG